MGNRNSQQHSEASSAESSVPNELIQLTKRSKRNNAGDEILQVDMDNVSKVLGNPEYKDFYVAIYTISGPTRSGKSFLLSLFLQFLQRNDEKCSYQQWSNDVNRIQKIFKWINRVKSYTQGIYILKEPIILKEEKIALFLVDTQGMFDFGTSKRNQTFLGTFSFLISSFLLFNVDKGIKTPHLESIQEYATNLRGSDGRFIMQKESLMFVVRDWISVNNDDDSGGSYVSNVSEEQNFAYGMEGGKQYFETLIEEDFPNKAKEHKAMREYLQYAFGENIPCCLLPHPGNAVAGETCSVADLSEDFRRESFKFFQDIEEKCQLKIKEIQDERCKCGELCKAIQDYVSQLGVNLDVPNQRDSFFETDFKVKMSLHVRIRVEEFVKSSNAHEVWEDHTQFEKNLQDLKKETVSRFNQIAGKFYPMRALMEWEEELNRILSQIIRILKTCLNASRTYIKAVHDYNGWHQSNVRKHLDTGSGKFIIQATKKRNSLLQQMKKNLRQKDVYKLDQILSHCNDNFVEYTDKLNKDVDADIDKFEFYSEVVKLVVIGVDFGLGALASFCLSHLGAEKAQAAGPVGAVAVLGQLEKIGQKGTEKFFEEKIKRSATKELSSSLELQQYKEGEIEVKLPFGTIKFKVECAKKD